MIIRKRKPDNYAHFDNFVFSDDRISLKAQGLLCYLLSKPDGWNAKTKDIINRHKDGRESVLSSMNELIELGYVSRKRKHKKDGKFGELDYLVYDTPFENPGYKDNINNLNVGETVSGKPDYGKADSGKPVRIVLYNSSTTEVSTTDKEEEGVQEKSIDVSMPDRQSLEEATTPPPTPSPESDPPFHELIPQQLRKSRFIEAWVEWNEFRRKELKKKLGPIGAKRQLADMLKWSGGNIDTCVSIMQASINAGWQGLFPLKTFNSNTNNKNTNGEFKPEKHFPTRPTI